MKQTRSKLRRLTSRSGVVLVCVLACTLIAVSVAGSALHLAMRAAQASKQNLRSRQTQWLLQAGVRRAHDGLRHTAYTGEEWLIPRDQLPESAGRVVVEVQPQESASETITWQVTVIAEYGPIGSQVTRRSHTFGAKR